MYAFLAMSKLHEVKAAHEAGTLKLDPPVLVMDRKTMQPVAVLMDYATFTAQQAALKLAGITVSDT